MKRLTILLLSLLFTCSIAYSADKMIFLDGGASSGTSSSAITRAITTPDLAGNLYAVLPTDYMILINDADAQVSGTVVVGLPAAANNTGRVLIIKKIAAAQIVRLDGYGGETIDGENTKDLASQYDSLTVQCNGTAWYIQ